MKFLKTIIILSLFITTYLSADELRFNIKNYNYNSPISRVYVVEQNGSKVLIADNNLSYDSDNNISYFGATIGDKYSIYIQTYDSRFYRYDFGDKKAYIDSIESNSTTILSAVDYIFEFDASRLNFIDERFYSTISIGDGHTLALKSDGSLWSWGSNQSGQLGDDTFASRYEPKQITTNIYKMIATGKEHSAAIDANGTLYTWGNNLSGQLGKGDTLGESSPHQVDANKYKWVSAKGNYTVAIRDDGTLWSSGENNQTSFTQVASASNWKKVSAGYSHTMAINDNGELYAWGDNISGELGIVNISHSDTPIQVGSDSDWLDVDVGFNHTIALKSDGTVYGWGDNSYGELGLGDNINRDTPTQIASLSDIVKVVAGVNFSIAISKDAQVYIFGRNDYGQLAQHTLISTNLAQNVYSEMSDIVDIYAGGQSSIFIDSYGRTLVSGNNEFGQLGYPSRDKTTLTKIGDEYIKYKKVSIASTHALAIDEYGYMSGWGNNCYGVLGADVVPCSISVDKQYINYDYDWKDVKTSPNSAVALKNDGTLYMWGLLESNSTTPIQVGSDSNWSSEFSVGDTQIVALKNDGSLWSWGIDNITPSKIGSDSWSKVSAGASHILAIKSDNTLWAWGSNQFGELGDGTFSDSLIPKQINGDSWNEISGGKDFTLAIKSDGTLWSCGNNEFYQLGDGTTDINSSLHQVGLDSDWVKVSASTNYAVAIKSDGTIWGWGKNIGSNELFGETSSSTPIKISDKSNWIDIDSAQTFIVARDDLNETYVAGKNDNAQLGDFWLTFPKSIQDIYKVDIYDNGYDNYKIDLVDTNDKVYESLNGNIFYIDYDNNYSITILFDNGNKYWYDFNESIFYPYENNSTISFQSDYNMQYYIPSMYINLETALANIDVTVPEIVYDDGKKVFPMEKEITLYDYESATSLAKEIPFDIYWIDSYYDDAMQKVSLQKTLLLLDGNITQTDKEFDENGSLVYEDVSNNQRYEKNLDNTMVISEDNIPMFEVKFVADVNNSELKDIYLSENIDINFSSNAKGMELYTKNLIEDLELYGKVERDSYFYTSLDDFIADHTLSTNNPFMINDINSSKALLFENNSSNNLVEIDIYTKSVINQNAGTFQRVNEPKNYRYRDSEILIEDTTNDMLILDINDYEGYQTKRAYVLANHDSSLYEGEYRDINTTFTQVVLNSYAINDIAKYLYEDNSTLVENPPYFTQTFDTQIILEDSSEIVIPLGLVKDENTVISLNVSDYSKAEVYIDYNKSSIVINPYSDEYGYIAIDINSTGVDGSVIKSFYVYIEGVNDSPTMSDISNINLSEDFNSTIVPFFIDDIDGDDLNVTIYYDSSLLNIDSNELNKFLTQGEYRDKSIDLNLTSIPDKNGQTYVTILVSDANLTVSKKFKVNIESVNDKPILESIDSINIIDLNQYQITLNATDAENDNLIYSATIDNPTIADINVTDNILSITPYIDGIATINVSVTDGLLSDTKSFDLNISLQTQSNYEKELITISNGWNFLSFTTSNIICDRLIQTALEDICNQEYTLNSIFGEDSNIQYIYKYADGWLYWDNQSGIDARYKVDKLSLISSKEGFALKSNATMTIEIPKNLINDEDEFVDLYKEGWYLVGVNSDKSVSDIVYMITKQGRELLHLWVYRGGKWYFYSPSIINRSYPSIESLKSSEGFWINVK